MKHCVDTKPRLRCLFLQLLHEAVMSVRVTTIYGRWRGTITGGEGTVYLSTSAFNILRFCRVLFALKNYSGRRMQKMATEKLRARLGIFMQKVSRTNIPCSFHCCNL